MKDYNIYLSGGMASFGKENFSKSNDWRVYIKYVLEHTDTSKYRVNAYNPNDYYSFYDDDIWKISDKEIMEYDLYRLRKSDLLIVNFNDKNSLGTMSEIAIAYDRNIPIIGLDENKQVLHSWQLEMCNKIFNYKDELLDYVEKYYLT